MTRTAWVEMGHWKSSSSRATAVARESGRRVRRSWRVDIWIAYRIDRRIESQDLKVRLQEGIMGGMVRKKTTIYLEPDLLTATKTLAASSGRREYEVIEDALRVYMRSDEAAAGRRELRAMLDRWSEQDTGLDEDEAIELATREVHAYRSEQSDKQR